MEHHHSSFVREPHGCKRGTGWRQFKGCISRSKGISIPVMPPIFTKTAASVQTERYTDVVGIVNITLGKVAFDNCVKFYKKNYDLNSKFKFIHGKSYSLPGNIRLVACYHPSPRNVNTKLISEKMIVDLFLKAKKISKV